MLKIGLVFKKFPSFTGKLLENSYKVGMFANPTKHRYFRHSKVSHKNAVIFFIIVSVLVIGLAAHTLELDTGVEPNPGPKSSRKQPCRGVLRKTCSENIQQIYRRIYCIFSEHFFIRTPLDGCLCLVLNVLCQLTVVHYSIILEH